jgi:hypothetical protein
MEVINMSSTYAPRELRDFALKKQAPSDGIVNTVLNFIATYFMIGSVALVPVVAPPGSSFSKSVLGSLVVPAVLIAFVISLVTTKSTISKRIKGEVVPKLQPGRSWIGWAFGWGLTRAVINLLVVYGIAGVIIQFHPGAEVSRITASVIVAVIAGVLAYIESAYAILRTRELG